MTTTAHRSRSTNKLAGLIILLCVVASTGSMVTILNLRTMNQFRHDTAWPFYMISGSLDKYEVCFHDLFGNLCQPGLSGNSQCAAVSASCDCYNWGFAEATGPVYATQGMASNCVIFQPLETGNITFQWQVATTPNILPPGYSQGIGFMFSKAYFHHRMTFSDYTALITPLVCQALQLQREFSPAIDFCSHTVKLAILALRHPDTNGILTVTTPSTDHRADFGAIVIMVVVIFLLCLLLMQLYKHHRHNPEKAF